MYFTTAWSKVVSLDAASGARRWEYDPKVPPEWAVNACCDVVNRGVAAWKGKVFVGTLDGRLIALDAATGKPVWETLTIDPKMRYTITGAPRVVKGKVIIGNGGAEMGVRGYVSAYDAETGKLVVALLYRAGRSVEAVRKPGPGKSGKNVERRVVEERRGRHRLGLHGLRSAARLVVHRHGECRSMGAENPECSCRRQSAGLVDRRSQAGHG